MNFCMFSRRNPSSLREKGSRMNGTQYWRVWNMNANAFISFDRGTLYGMISAFSHPLWIKFTLSLPERLMIRTSKHTNRYHYNATVIPHTFPRHKASCISLCLFITFFVFLYFSHSLYAETPVVPIRKATVLMANRSYVLMEDITAQKGPAFILRGENITFDLSSHTIHQLDNKNPVIIIEKGNHTTVLNGSIIGGTVGILVQNTKGPISFKHLIIQKSGLHGIFSFEGLTLNSQLSISDVTMNMVQHTGIFILGLMPAHISRVRIRYPGEYGISIKKGGHVLIQDVIIEGYDTGILIQKSHFLKIQRNKVAGCMYGYYLFKSNWIFMANNKAIQDNVGFFEFKSRIRKWQQNEECHTTHYMKKIRCIHTPAPRKPIHPKPPYQTRPIPLREKMKHP